MSAIKQEHPTVGMNAHKSFKARVEVNFEVSPGYRLLTLMPLDADSTEPPRAGQFYMVSPGVGAEPLLKRPFCYFEAAGDGSISMLYKVMGRGTAALAATGKGAVLDLLGPLGNYYTDPPRGKKPLIVAGGIGIASVMPLIREFGAKARVVFGARTADELVMRKEVSVFLCELHGCTDDGTVGLKGNVVDMLRQMDPGKETVMYVCGPTPMTKAVVDFAAERGIKGYASLEEHMACGIGACMGCVVMTKNGYRRVCKEGPIFKLEELAI